MRLIRLIATAAFVLLLTGSVALAADPEKERPDTSKGDRLLAAYFQSETKRLADACLSDIRTLDDWESRRGEYRRQLFEMLGLDPLPERTPLEPVVTGTIEQPDFTVEKLHFQSRPGLYVTGNLYLPKNVQGKAPAILYVCGHGRVKENGVSYGNKVAYQHHGIWFARNGYVCLTIDTLQLGEIEGLHHGTHNLGQWWWNARGYTPAGVEAWNCIRALDYLESRPEVDARRIGVTGRSGGGAYSWWIAALDDRIQVAVPVAGITTLKNHVVDGCVEGHCDCMFMVNTYRWDYPQVAALVAPRPLLISNTDKDSIFPLDGVVETYFKVRPLYGLYGKLDHLGLNITEGPHKDTQELQTHAFVWFNRFLKKEQPLIEMAAVKMFEPKELKVFDELPSDEVNTTIQETFTAKAPEPAMPESPQAWQIQRDDWIQALREKCFRGWPEEGELEVKEIPDWNETHVLQKDQTVVYEFTSQSPYRLAVRIRRPQFDTQRPPSLTLFVLDGSYAVGHDQLDLSYALNPYAQFWVRGSGNTEWTRDEKKRTHIERRFNLLGQTLDGMRVWDVRRAIQAIRSTEEFRDIPIHLRGERTAAGIALYAALFEPNIARVELIDPPHSHREGPIFLNLLRYLDMPQAVAMVAEKSRVHIYQDDDAGWEYPREVARKLGWGEGRVLVHSGPAVDAGGEGESK